MSLKRTIINQGLRAIEATRADIWLGPLAQGRGVILMMHHVRPPRESAFAPNGLLEITPEFLDLTISLVKEMGFDFIPMDDVGRRLNATQDRPFAVLTFDDGYRDNAEYALPVLRRHSVPAILYVTTAFADGEGRLWWLELEEAIARLDRIVFHHDGRDFDLTAHSAQEKQRAFDAVYWRLRSGNEEALLHVIAELAASAGVNSGQLTRRLCMDWQALAEIAKEPDIAIGAHTCTHPMLAKHDAQTVRSELTASREQIEDRLKCAVRHLAYPVGDPTSAGPRDFGIAREAGYETAVTTRPGHVFQAHRDHMHALPRVSVNGLHQNRATMRSLLSGVPFLAWNRGRRVNVD
ncbi:MAG TPA: polysaccharide deacetylase family protein [Saliniramus sp.]|nr:polysaccharide deacetylase family protein [Saliniramus sp.]